MLLLQRNEIAIVQSLLTGVPERLSIDASSTNQGEASGQLSCACVLSSFARPNSWEDPPAVITAPKPIALAPHFHASWPPHARPRHPLRLAVSRSCRHLQSRLR